MLSLLLSTVIFTSPVPESFAIHDVKIEIGDGKTISSGTVWIEKGRIRAVGDEVKLPASLPKINGKGKILTPGFFETQTQLGLFEVGAEESTVDYQMRNRSVAPAFRAVDGFNPASVRIPIEREEGVTHVIASPQGGLLFGMGFLFQLDQSPAGILDKAIALFGSVDVSAANAHGHSRAGVWMKLREVFDDSAFYRKNQKQVDKGQTRPLSLSAMQLKSLWPILDGKKKFVLLAHRVSDIRAVIRFRNDQKRKGRNLEIILAGGGEAWLVGKELAAADIPVILTPSAQMPYSFSMLKARDDSPALLEKEGVKVILSSATWANNVRRLRQEAGIAVSHGMSHQGALRSISLAPAEAFGIDDQLGSIQAGKRAHLVLWSGDPLELRTHAEKMWIDGKEVRLDDRQRALARRYLRKKSPEAKEKSRK